MAKHATLPQIVEIGGLLKNYCLRDDATGLAMYLSGWSDQIIASKVGAPLSSVANLRVKMVGPLISPKGESKPKHGDDLKLEVERLKAAVSALQHQVQALHAANIAYDRQLKQVTAELLSSTSLVKL